MNIHPSSLCRAALYILPCLVVWSTDAGAQLTLSAGRCLTDDEVPAAERAPYEQPALNFVQLVVGDKLDQAYELFTDAAKTSASKESFISLARRLNEYVGTLGDLHVLHSYRMSQTTASIGSAQDQRVLCTTVAHGSTSKPDGWIAAAAKPIPLQAHVIVEGKARNASWDFVIWVTEDQAGWGVFRFDEVQATILDKSQQHIWGMAREQQGRGHDFNAFVLFHAALQLTDRGPAFQLGIQNAIQKDLASMSPPPHLSGKPPFIWTAGDRAFRILNVGPTGVGKTFDLVVWQQLAQWVTKIIWSGRTMLCWTS
jgi:hypothetical protein